MIQEQYLTKKQEVLGKFTSEFSTEAFVKDPMFRQVAELLIRDADPYFIIEMLIKDRQIIIDQSKSLLNKMPIQIIKP